jgi:hypothetical protein
MRSPRGGDEKRLGANYLSCVSRSVTPALPSLHRGPAGSWVLGNLIDHNAIRLAIAVFIILNILTKKHEAGEKQADLIIQ